MKPLLPRMTLDEAADVMTERTGAAPVTSRLAGGGAHEPKDFRVSYGTSI